MKKIFAFLLSVLSFTAVNAQNFNYAFVDESGNVIQDGSTVVRNTVTTDDPMTPNPMIKSGVFVKYTGTETDAANISDLVGIFCNINEMPYGTFQICYPIQCSVHGDGNYPYSEEYDAGADQIGSLDSKDIMAEWILPESQPADAANTFTVDLQLYIKTMFGTVDGPKITVKFDNTTTSINGIQDNGAKVVSRYTIGGQMVNAPVRGINIMKLSNGKTIKYFNK